MMPDGADEDSDVSVPEPREPEGQQEQASGSAETEPSASRLFVVLRPPAVRLESGQVLECEDVVKTLRMRLEHMEVVPEEAVVDDPEAWQLTIDARGSSIHIEVRDSRGTVLMTRRMIRPNY